MHICLFYIYIALYVLLLRFLKVLSFVCHHFLVNLWVQNLIRFSQMLFLKGEGNKISHFAKWVGHAPRVLSVNDTHGHWSTGRAWPQHCHGYIQILYSIIAD